MDIGGECFIANFCLIQYYGPLENIFLKKLGLFPIFLRST